MVLGVPERAGPRFGGLADLVIGGRSLRPPGELVGDLALPVGGGGVCEDDVQVQVEQVRDRAEDLGGDLVEGREQEVHRRVGGVLAEPRAALDRDPLGHPAGGRQLGARFQRPLRHQREDHPLGGLPVQPAARRHPPDRTADLQPLPQLAEHPRPAQPPRIEHFDLGGRRRGHRLLRVRGTGRSRRPAGPAPPGRPCRRGRSCGSPWRPGCRCAGAARCAPAAGRTPRCRPC